MRNWAPMPMTSFGAAVHPSTREEWPLLTCQLPQAWKADSYLTKKLYAHLEADPGRVRVEWLACDS